MAERAELMGGRLEVTSRPGLGTTVTAVIPLSPKPPPTRPNRAGPGRPAAGGESPGVQAPVPDGDHQAGIADGQGAGQVDGIGAAQSVNAGQAAGMLLHGGGQLDRADSRPIPV